MQGYVKGNVLSFVITSSNLSGIKVKEGKEFILPSKRFLWCLREQCHASDIGPQDSQL